MIDDRVFHYFSLEANEGNKYLFYDERGQVTKSKAMRGHEETTNNT
jgi:hypothetical protein